MRVCWKIMILLGCTLWHASQTQSTCPWNHQQTTVCVPAGGNVSVPCLKPKAGEEMTFTLYKDGEKFPNHSCHFDKYEFTCRSNTSVGEAVPYKNESVSFLLTRLASGSQGTYVCETTVMYPPPSRVLDNASRILVIAEGDPFQCRTSGQGDHKVLVCHWIWVSVIAVVCTYSVVVTIIAVVNCIKLRHSDSQNDYINTKPRAPMDRNKKRWFQNPIPRHF